MCGPLVQITGKTIELSPHTLNGIFPKEPLPMNIPENAADETNSRDPSFASPF